MKNLGITSDYLLLFGLGSLFSSKILMSILLLLKEKLLNLLDTIWEYIKEYIIVTYEPIQNNEAIIEKIKIYDKDLYNSLKFKSADVNERGNKCNYSYCSKFCFIKGIPIYIMFTKKVTKNESFYEMYFITLQWYSEKLYLIVKEIMLIDTEKKNTRLKIGNINIDDDGRLHESSSLFINKIPEESLFIDKNIINSIDNVLTNRSQQKYDKKYFRSGSNKAVILLYGPPGTCKTSTIEYFCSKYDVELHYVNINKNYRVSTLTMIINEAYWTFDDGGVKESFIVFEDIDNIFENKEVRSDYKIDLRTLLQIFDGKFSSKKFTIFITTNYIEKLPENMLRTKRIDLKLEFKGPSPKMIREICDRAKYDGDTEQFIKDHNGKSHADVINDLFN